MFGTDHNYSDESVRSRNQLVIFGTAALCIVGSLLSELEFIDTEKVGLGKYWAHEWLRWYGTDYVNGIMWHSAFSLLIGASIYSFALRKDGVMPLFTQGFPTLLMLAGIGASANVEYMQAISRGAEFDWPDMIAYTAGYGTSTLAIKGIHAKASQKLRQ